MTSIKAIDFKRHLEAQACVFIRHRGNHQVWAKGDRQAVVTGDRKDISPGLVRQACKRLGIEFP